MSCGYTGYDFGARYEDSICVDGGLWDADSFEDGMLTSGEQIPCPRCNTATWIGYHLECILQDCCQEGQATPAELVELTFKRALKENTSAATKAIRELQPFEAEDWRDRDAIRAGCRGSNDQIILRKWPWPIPGLTGHQILAIQPTKRTDLA